MLGDLEWDTLEIRRKKIRLTMMYKIINNLIDISKYFDEASDVSLCPLRM
jgi:hypothetical protein